MSEQTETLAARCLERCNTLVAVLTQCSDDAWQTRPTGDDRTLGMIMHHIAGAYLANIDLITAVLNGQPVPYMFQDTAALDRWNATYAEQHKDCTRAETIALLEEHSAIAAQFIRGLSDEQLRQTSDYPLLVLWFGAPPTVAQLVEGMLITHPDRHLPDVSAVCAG